MLSRIPVTETNGVIVLPGISVDSDQFELVDSTPSTPHHRLRLITPPDLSYHYTHKAADYASGLSPQTGINRAMYKLVNLLYLYPRVLGPESQDPVQSILSFTGTVCDLCGGPGSWSKFMLDFTQARSVNGITAPTTNNAFKWYPQVMGNERFEFDYLDVVLDWNEILETHAERYNLVIADGGTSNNDPITEQVDRELLIIQQCVIGTRMLVSGGSMIVKMYYPSSFTVKSMIALMASCYEYVSPCKPVTSRATTTEFYLVCVNKVNECPNILDEVDRARVGGMVVVPNLDITDYYPEYLEFEYQSKSDNATAVDVASNYYRGRKLYVSSFNSPMISNIMFKLQVGRRNIV